MDILKYVYADLEIKENDQKYLKNEWGINGIRNLRNISEDYFRVVEGIDAKNSRIILTRQLQHMVAWMRYYKGENDDLPNTTEEWESDFNEDIFNDSEYGSIAVKYEVKEEEIESINKKDKSTTRMKFCMSDYPYFNGTA